MSVADSAYASAADSVADLAFGPAAASAADFVAAGPAAETAAGSTVNSSMCSVAHLTVICAAVRGFLF